jgi:hypothetical protein
LLATVSRYLELAARVIRESGAAASEAIRQRTGADSSELGEQVRTAAAALLQSCEDPA